MTEDAENSPRGAAQDAGAASPPDSDPVRSDRAAADWRNDDPMPKSAAADQAFPPRDGTAGESLSWAIRRSRELIEESQRILAESRREAPSRRWTRHD